MDVALIGDTLYALVSIVSDPFAPVGIHANHNGIYRVNSPDNCTLVADIGAFALAHPPDADIFLLAGVQYALEPYRGGFLVTDGRHNRVYRVTLDGAVSEFITLGNVVPTGLAQMHRQAGEARARQKPIQGHSRGTRPPFCFSNCSLSHDLAKKRVLF